MFLAVIVYRMLIGVVGALLVPLLASAAVAAALAVLGAGSWSPWIWLALAPALYFTWLLTFLALSALEFQLYGRIAPKPRRLAVSGGHLTARASILIHGYQRFYQVLGLPFAEGLLRLPVLQKLVLLSYSPKATVGRDVLIYGRIYDPELTTFGDGAIVGAGSALAAHATVSRGEGLGSYVTSPIRVGRWVTIGGECRVGLGVTIGDGAVIEPGSVVEPFTDIPPGEVWGGSPARLRRTASEAAPSGAASAGATPAAVVWRTPAPKDLSPAPGHSREAARRLVAAALGVPPDAIGPSASYIDTPGWDSLGQLVIATLAQERHGASVNPDEVHRLRTLADVERLISGRPADHVHATTAAAGSAGSLSSENPELLPLRDRADATRDLADRAPVAAAASRHCRVVIAATFTAQPLAPALRLWARAFGVDADVEVAGFDQLETALLSPSGAFRAGPGDALRVVLVRGEELAAEPAARLARARGLLAAIEQFTTDHGALIVGSLPPPLSPIGAPERSEGDALRAEWLQRLESIRGVEIVDVAGVVERLGSIAAGNAASEVMARMPWSPAACRDLGIEVARSVRRRFVPPAKVIAVDCDGTLWRGVVAEDGVGGLGVGGDGPDRAFQLFQRRLRELKDRGLLIALVSRNEEADVWRVFDEHPGMVLRREDVAAWRIGWQPKSQLLAELVMEMGLSPEAFVFLDDDPANRMEVAANAPGVLVVPLPGEPVERVAALSALWCFDGAEPTEVDQARTQMLGEERERQQVQREATDMASYLRDLHLVVSIHAATEAELPRLAQLTQRTNQFNTSLRRRTLDEVRGLTKEHTVLSLEAKDRFGEYGLVGLAVLEWDAPESARLDTLLMSCRALGRGIEQALLHVVVELALAHGASCLRAAWVDGPRNSPALAFLRESGFVEESDGSFAARLDRPFELPSHVSLETEGIAQALVLAGHATMA